MSKTLRLGALALALHASGAYADLKVSSRGELGIESRAFLTDGSGDDYNVAMAGRLMIQAKLKPFKLQVRGFARHDGVDRERSAFFPEDTWIEIKKDKLRIRAGYQMLNWTATEAFHPADIVNSRYFDGNVQNPEKLGELMLSARYKLLDGNVEAYFMPRFTEPLLPSPNSRYRFAPAGVRLPSARVIDYSGEISDDRWFPQWALRAQQSLRGADISLHVVQHVDRSLPLVLVDPNTFSPELYYQWVTQVGCTYQQVFGTVIAKVEGAYRWYKQLEDDPDGSVPNRDHGVVAVGLEWGFGHDSGGESTLLAEGQVALGLDDDAGGALLLFQRDVLAGYRYAHGDVADHTLTGSVIVDLEDPSEVFGAVELSRRLGETWRSQLGLRLVVFPPEDPDNPVGPEFLNNASYAYFNLTRFF